MKMWYVGCYVLPFQGKASSWFFSLALSSITSWRQFENAFITQFGDDKTLGTLFLDISIISLNKKEKVKDFNPIFITLLNRIHDNLVQVVQVNFYTTTLPPPVAMFIKRKEIQTLVENFVEAIKVEKDLSTISHHLGNEESEASTLEKTGKKNNETKLYGKDRVNFAIVE